MEKDKVLSETSKVDPNLTYKSMFLDVMKRGLIRSTTQLAIDSIKQLSGGEPGDLRDALKAMTLVGFAPGSLMNQLRRHVNIDDVLAGPAKGWLKDTVGDFAKTFTLEPVRLTVMDCLVSIAVLNDPDLEEQVRGENLTPPTDRDLMENRKVVWQHPPPGTPLEPPYVVLVAVEHEDIARAQDVVQSILGELTLFKNVRLPKVAVKNLG